MPLATFPPVQERIENCAIMSATLASILL